MGGTFLAGDLMLFRGWQVVNHQTSYKELWFVATLDKHWWVPPIPARVTKSPWRGHVDERTGWGFWMTSL